MNKTLYINESSKAIVRCDGPSLWIRYPNKSGQRIPVTEIGKVVIIGNVRLDAESITLFTERNIPVVFMTQNGKKYSVAVPFNHHIPKHHKEQRIFYTSFNNVYRYYNWAKTKKSVIQFYMLKRLFKKISKKAPTDIGEGNYQIIIKDFLPPNAKKIGAVKEVIKNLFMTLITNCLLNVDLDPHLGVINRWHNYGFVLDICYILDAEIDMQTIQFFNSKIDNSLLLSKNNYGDYFLTDEGMREVVIRFENRQDAITDMINSIIDDIFALMRELSL
ncbi:MAG: CRISPR-associated endonuclease Cas1 [Thermodesulfovibrionales bacterium]|nr:CRISPR-associated endonuclease Cas1 [Thermodesulfovibrionales bacterium]